MDLNRLLQNRKADNKMKKVLILLGILVLAAGLYIADAAAPAKESQALASEHKILARLQEVIDGQQTILAKLDEMKEQLRIIKIRASN
jgi:hypothetical protein